MRNAKSKDCSLDSIREQALKDTARSVKSIRRQRQQESDDNEEVRCALKDTEEAMILLAINSSGDDEDRTREILAKHGLDELG